MAQNDKLVKWSVSDYDELGDTQCIICLSERERHLLDAALRVMRWPQRWRVDIDAGETIPDIDAIASELSTKLMTCNALQFRPNPDDHCIAEYTTDGGETWSTMFNFGACMLPMVQDINQVTHDTGNRIIDELLDKYDGTAGSISANIVYDGSPNDEFRDNALCAILQILVDTMCAAELQRRQDVRLVWDDVGNLIEGIALIAVGFSVGWLAIPVAFGLALIGGAAALWEAVDTQFLNDEAAKDAVACQMYTAMSGSTPTQSSFIASLNFNSFFLFSPEWYITGAVKAMLPELEFYLAFLDLWGQFYPFAAEGLLDSCDCPETDWRVDFLDGNGEPPNTTLTGDTLYTSDYWYTIEPDAGDPCYVYAEFDLLADTNIKEIRVLTSKLNARYESKNTIYCLDEFDAIIDTDEDNDFCWVTGADDGCWSFNTAHVNFDEGLSVRKIKFAIQAFQNTTNKEARVLKIEIIGSGDKPVGW